MKIIIYWIIGAAIVFNQAFADSMLKRGHCSVWAADPQEYNFQNGFSERSKYPGRPDTMGISAYVDALTVIVEKDNMKMLDCFKGALLDSGFTNGKPNLAYRIIFKSKDGKEHSFVLFKN
ncbi:MAG: hypothetical protein H6620_05345 [Halobacteriovoraceae bacterium]|nr:hypothetical protein [Halobacteriovoraceae bacterium]